MHLTSWRRRLVPYTRSHTAVCRITAMLVHLKIDRSHIQQSRHLWCSFVERFSSTGFSSLFFLFCVKMVHAAFRFSVSFGYFKFWLLELTVSSVLTPYTVSCLTVDNGALHFNYQNPQYTCIVHFKHLGVDRYYISMNNEELICEVSNSSRHRLIVHVNATHNEVFINKSMLVSSH